MAGDWIKVESCTPNKPEVMKLARLLGVSRDDAFGKAMRFWIWVDGISVDGHVDGVTSHDVDAVVGAERVARAFESVGWLRIDDENQSIEIPNFERHNGQTAKARALKTNRQSKWRAKRVDGAASTEASPEKRREEKRIKRELKFSSSDMDVARSIWEMVESVVENPTTPNLKSWANTIRLIVERDGHSHSEILDLFTWANSDHFWWKNIQSPEKLRKQWNNLQSQRAGPKRQLRPRVTASSRSERNRRVLEEYKRRSSCHSEIS